MVALGGGAVSYERGTPVWHTYDSQYQILAQPLPEGEGAGRVAQPS